jgi:hypothetical protein
MAPVVLAKVPAAHGEHTESPPPEKVPTWQGTGAAAGSAHAWPAGQGAQEDAPVRFAKVPEAHAPQEGAPPGANVPARQVMEGEAPPPQEEPGGQDWRWEGTGGEGGKVRGGSDSSRVAFYVLYSRRRRSSPASCSFRRGKSGRQHGCGARRGVGRSGREVERRRRDFRVAREIAPDPKPAPGKEQQEEPRRGRWRAGEASRARHCRWRTGKWERVRRVDGGAGEITRVGKRLWGERSERVGISTRAWPRPPCPPAGVCVNQPQGPGGVMAWCSLGACVVQDSREKKGSCA